MFKVSKENKCTTNMFDSGWFSGALCTCQPESFFGFCKAISNSQQESHALSKPRERGSAKAVAP